MGDFIATGYDSVSNEPIDRTLTELGAELAAAGATPSRIIRDNFRGYVGGNLWRGTSCSYGPATPNWSQSLGNGDTPGWNWYHKGYPIRAGETIKSLTIMGRANHASAAQMQYHWTFRTGDWNNSLDSVAETDFTDVFVGTMDTATPGAGQSRHVATADFTAPSDGVLMPCLRGSNGSTLVFYGEIMLEVQP